MGEQVRFGEKPDVAAQGQDGVSAVEALARSVVLLRQLDALLVRLGGERISVKRFTGPGA
jgi:hypothetical protein